MRKWGITFAVVSCLLVPSLSRAEEPLPSSGELLERMAVASGKREAWNSTQSLMTRTSLRGIGVATQMVSVYCEKTGRTFRITKRDDEREFREVCDGKVGWKIDWNGNIQLMSESEVAGWSTVRDPNTRVEDKSGFKVTGTSTVDGVPVYTATFTNPMREETIAYIDVKTSLVLQTRIVRRFDGKNVIEITKMLDYKDFGGMKISTKQMRYTNLHLMTFTVDVERNVDPPAGIFDMPDKVKELLAEKATRASTQPASTQTSDPQN